MLKNDKNYSSYRSFNGLLLISIKCWIVNFLNCIFIKIEMSKRFYKILIAFDDVNVYVYIYIYIYLYIYIYIYTRLQVFDEELHPSPEWKAN